MSPISPTVYEGLEMEDESGRGGIAVGMVSGMSPAVSRQLLEEVCCLRRQFGFDPHHGVVHDV